MHLIGALMKQKVRRGRTVVIWSNSKPFSHPVSTVTLSVLLVLYFPRMCYLNSSTILDDPRRGRKVPTFGPNDWMRMPFVLRA